MLLPKDLLKISPLVAKALAEGKPVVSLESTIISHGMPYPNNKQCAIEVEDLIRNRGVEPATVAIMNKRICIGLTHDQIEELAQGGSQARKVSRRDIPYVLAQGGLGSTTVAGTMICSAMAGIDIFVTGGLGGVHRGYEETMDVSADLRQLGRTPVTVVSAGVKNILDIPRTLQYLETEGVPVVTYGSKYFPAFFAPSSSLLSPISFDKIEDIAEMLLMRKKLDLQNGILVAVPNQDTQNGQKIEKAIQQALKQAEQQKIRGAATTPFLLKRVHSLTQGASIKTNISLVKHNAEVGAALALEYNQRLRKSQKRVHSFHSEAKKSITQSKNKGKLIVIGGSALDYQVTIQGKFHLSQSCKGKWRTIFGGVGRNISQVASRLGTQTVFITALGSDSSSDQIRNNIQSLGIDLIPIVNAEMKAPTFLGVTDSSKEPIIAISDMDINKHLTFSKVKQVFLNQEEKRGINHNDIVVIDANVEATDGNLLLLLEYLNKLGYFIVYQCKGRKSYRPALEKTYQYISLLKMNQKEMQLFIETLNKEGENIKKGEEYQWLSKNVGSKTNNNMHTSVNAIITRDSNDITVISREGEWENIKIVKSDKVKKLSGAGDTFTGTLCSMLLRGESTQTAIKYSVLASKLTIESQGKDSVISDQLTIEALEERYNNSRVKYAI